MVWSRNNDRPHHTPADGLSPARRRRRVHDDPVPAAAHHRTVGGQHLRDRGSVGFVLVFKATEIFNFAQGNLMVVGAYLGYTFIHTLHLPAPARRHGRRARGRRYRRRAALLAVPADARQAGAVDHHGDDRPRADHQRGDHHRRTARSGSPTRTSCPTNVLDWHGLRVSTLDLLIIGIAGGVRHRLRHVLPSIADRPADAGDGGELRSSLAVGCQRRPGLRHRARRSAPGWRRSAGSCWRRPTCSRST